MRINRINKHLILGLALLSLFGITACGRELRQGASQIDGMKPSPEIKQQGLAESAENRTLGEPERASSNDNMPINPNGMLNGTEESRIAEELIAMKEIKQAQVLVINDLAFVSILPDYGNQTVPMDDTVHHHAVVGEVSEILSGRIKANVIEMEPRVTNVYVSAHPDFIERIGTLTQMVRNGQPLSGHIQDFNALLNRLFPLAQTTTFSLHEIPFNRIIR